MIAYVDSSVLTRACLADEPGHASARLLFDDDDTALVTGTWTRIEVTGALVRAARAARGDEKGLLDLLDLHLSADGAVTVVDAPQADVEVGAIAMVRRHGLRAMDARHLAVAQIVLPAMAEPGEAQGFATRDDEQAAVAAGLGFVAV